LAENNFRTIVGVVQFPPSTGQANGKDVRNIAVRQTGVHAKEALRVSSTLWPSFDHVVVQEGDVVVLDGKYTENRGTDKDGNPRTYHNLSVSSIAVIGRVDTGAEPGVENAQPAADAADDDIPF